jgi:hypothetical protein
MKVELHLEKWFVNARGWYWKPVKLNCTAPKNVAGVWRWLFFGWVYTPNNSFNLTLRAG